jgi:hypothetical protein
LDKVTAVHRAIRTIHLAAGLFALPFLAIYFSSGVQMAHRSWWPLGSRVTERSFTLPKGLDAREVTRRLPVRGELASVFMIPAGPHLLIARPGTTYWVSYSPSTGEAQVRTTTSGFPGMLVSLHRSKGMWHGYLPLDAWADGLGLVSLALLAMGATGLYLWFQNRAERRAGFALLAAGAGIALALIVSMRLG